MSEYNQLPPDLRMTIENRPLLYWTKRGKAVIVKDEIRAKELSQQGLLWRKIKDEEIESGVKAGDYNPVFDMGDGSVQIIDIPDPKLRDPLGDILEVIRI